MYTVRDGALAAWHSASASEMGCRLTCRAAPQGRSRGPQSDTLPGMADRPSERRRPGPPTPDLAGTEPGTPSTHARGQGGRDAAKSFSDTPQGMVARPAKRQAAVG